MERALRAGFTDGPVYRGSWRLGSSGGLFGIGCFDESGICRSDVRCNGPALADRWYPANAGSSLQQVTDQPAGARLSGRPDSPGIGIVQGHYLERQRPLRLIRMSVFMPQSVADIARVDSRSEEHTSELQSLMR